MNRSDKGSTLIEFLVIAPFLTMVIGGAIGFGALFYEHRMLAEAAYVGTTAAAKLDPSKTPSGSEARDTIEAAIQKFLSDANFDPAQFDWKIDDQSTNGALPSNVIQVTVGRNSAKTFRMFGFSLGAQGCGQSAAMIDGYSVDTKTAILPGC